MFIVEKRPKSISAEAYKSLRTNIRYSSFDSEIRVIVVTSSEAGEGKSTTAGNLALSFAQDQKRTIMIDCDLRKPSLHKKFRVSNMIGLSDLLKGKENLKETVHSYNEYLDILTSGKLPPNPSEMLGSRAMSNLLEKLRDEYDIIILDTAPLQAVTDAQVLSTKADGTIIVVRAEKTKREVVMQSKEILEKVDAKILGVVLNGVKNMKKKYYYYYGTDEKEK